MSEHLHRELADLCADLNIEFMSTAFDEDSLDLLVGLGIRRIKVPSGELTNEPFLRFMAGKDLPLIVSTGMADLAEVEEAVKVIADERGALSLSGPLEDLVTILHCTSNYPTDVADVNLNAMLTMAKATGLPVGYSDHTLGTTVAIAAVAMGAKVIEKHFTLDRSLPGPDHGASLTPEELKSMVDSIRAVEKALGDGVKAPTATELPVRALVRRSVTTTRPLAAGTVLQPSDLTLMRPGYGIPPKALAGLFGRETTRDLAAGETVNWADLL